MKKMNLDNLKKELVARGINAEYVEIMKNGITCCGFRILDSSKKILPIVYYSQEDTIESFLERIESSLVHTPNFNFNLLSDRDYILDHIYVSVQRRNGNGSVIKKEYLNVDVLLKVNVSFADCDDFGSIKVPEELLALSGVSQDDAWHAALRNVSNNLRVRSLAEIVGVSEESFPSPFFVITTENGIDGAAALLFPNIFRAFCEVQKCKSCLILPSSTQEVLVVPEDEQIVELSYGDFAKLVDDVNRNEVHPIIQLDPAVYRYDVFTNYIKIVAEV